jgi:hypothetical protein
VLLNQTVLSNDSGVDSPSNFFWYNIFISSSVRGCDFLGLFPFNTLQKTVRDVAMATKFLKLKNETRELHKIEPTELDPLISSGTTYLFHHQ